MKFNLIPLSLLATTILLFSCQRELSGLPPTPPPVPQIPDTVATDPLPPPVALPDNQVVTNLQGRILDEAGRPMQGAEVMAGSKTTYTDEYGIFRLTSVLVAEHFTFIRAVKQGYFTGSRTIISEANGNGFVQIKMLRKNSAGTFNTSLGGEINVESKATIQFPAYSIKTAAGAPYTGKVKVYATFLDPDAADFDDIMPGDLRGLNADSQRVALKSYGMLNVSLETESGQTLQIADGKKADIRMKVSSSLMGNTPAEIPLWHFSESDGKWREEGKAILQNGWYAGSVTHFSTWNVDIPVDFVLVTLKVRGEKGTRRPYTRVKFTNTENGLYSDGYTDSAGYIKTYVPKNAPLKLEILTDCGDLLYEENIGPFSADVDLESVTVAPRQLIRVQGTVTGCDDEPVSTGFAILNLRGLNYVSDVQNGEYYFYISKCLWETSEGELFITNSFRTHQSSSKVIEVGSQNVNAGNFKVCELGSFEYLAFSLGTDSVMVETPPATMTYDAFVGDTATKISFNWGIYDVGFSNLTVEFYDTTVHTSTVMSPAPMLYHNDELIAVEPMIVEVKNISRVGLFMYLTFRGKYQNVRTGEISPLNGEIRVKRRK